MFLRALLKKNQAQIKHLLYYGEIFVILYICCLHVQGAAMFFASGSLKVPRANFVPMMSEISALSNGVVRLTF